MGKVLILPTWLTALSWEAGGPGESPNDCPDLRCCILAYTLQDKGRKGICQFWARLLRPNLAPQLTWM